MRLAACAQLRASAGSQVVKTRMQQVAPEAREYGRTLPGLLLIARYGARGGDATATQPFSSACHCQVVQAGGRAWFVSWLCGVIVAGGAAQRHHHHVVRSLSPWL